MAHQSPGIFNASQYFGNNGPSQELQNSSNGLISENTPEMDGFFAEDSWPAWPEDNHENQPHKQGGFWGNDSSSSSSEIDTHSTHKAQSSPAKSWPYEQVSQKQGFQHQSMAPPGHYNHAVQDRPSAPSNSYDNYQDNFPALPNMGARQPANQNPPPPPFSNPSSQPPVGALAWQKSPRGVGARRSPYAKQQNYMQGPPSPAHQGQVPGGQNAALFFESVPTSGHQSMPPVPRGGQPPLFPSSTPQQQGPPLTQLGHSFGPAVLPVSQTVEQNVPSWFDGNNSGSDPSGQKVAPMSNEHSPAVFPMHSTDGQNANAWFGSSNSDSLSSQAEQNVFPGSDQRGPDAADGHNAASWFENHNFNPNTQDSGHTLFPSSNVPDAAVLPPSSTSEQNAALRFQTGDSGSPLLNGYTFPPSTTNDQHASSFSEAGNPGSGTQGDLFGESDRTSSVRSEPVQNNPSFTPSTSDMQSNEPWIETSKPGSHVQEGSNVVPEAVEETVPQASQNSELETLPMQDTTPVQGFYPSSLRSGPPGMDGQNPTPWFVPGNPTEPPKPAQLSYTSQEPVVTRASGDTGIMQPQATQQPSVNQGGLFEPTGPPKGPQPFHTPEIFAPFSGTNDPGMRQTLNGPIQQRSNPNEGGHFEPTGPPKEAPSFYTPNDFDTPTSGAGDAGIAPTQAEPIQQSSFGSTGPPKGPPLFYTPKESDTLRSGAGGAGIAPTQAEPIQQSSFEHSGLPKGSPLFYTPENSQALRSEIRDPTQKPMQQSSHLNPFESTGPPQGPPLFYTPGSGANEPEAAQMAQPAHLSQDVPTKPPGPPRGPQLFNTPTESSVAPASQTSEAGMVPRQAAPVLLPHDTRANPPEVDQYSTNRGHPDAISADNQERTPSRGEMRQPEISSVQEPGPPPVAVGQNVAVSRPPAGPQSAPHLVPSSDAGDAAESRVAKLGQPHSPKPQSGLGGARDNPEAESRRAENVRRGIDQQKRNVFGSLEALMDSAADTDIYEGSLQKQQQRQKEGVSSKAPLSSLWSSGPGMGTPYRLAPVQQASPQLEGAKQLGKEELSSNKVKQQQIPLVGVLPINLAQKQIHPQAPSSVPTSESEDTAAFKLDNSFQKRNQQGDSIQARCPSEHYNETSKGFTNDREQDNSRTSDERESVPSRTCDHRQADRGQGSEQAPHYGNNSKTETKEFREHNTRYQEPNDARGPIQAHEHEEQSRPYQEAPQFNSQEDRRHGSNTNELTKRSTETAAPYQEHQDQHSAYPQDNQDRRRPHSDEYRETTTPYQIQEDPPAAYQQDDQGTQGPRADRYTKQTTKAATPYQEHEDPRAAYERDDQDRRRAHAGEYREQNKKTATPYQEHEDPRAAYERDDQDRRRAHAGEYREQNKKTATPYQEHEDPRAPYERDDQDRRRADEYRETTAPYQEQDDPPSAYRQDNQSGYGPHANDYRDYNARADMYYQGHEDPRAVYPQHPQSGGGTPGSSGRNTPSQYYQQQQQQQQQWPGYYPYDPRYQQYYGGYYPGYSPYNQYQQQQYAQYYQQYYYPSQYGWGYSPSQSHSSYEGSQVADSMDGRESRERLPEGEGVVALDESPESSVQEEVEDEEAGRITPLLYTTPTPSCKFTPDGKLLIVPPNQPLDGQMAAVKIADIQALFSEKEMKLMEEYPGPLLRDTSKGDVMAYTDAMAEECQLDQRTGDAIMWKVLGLLCKHSGTFVMSEVASLLAKFWDRPSSQVACAPVEEEGGEGEEEPAHAVLHDDKTALIMLREMLVVGSRKEALEYAMQHQMWGHALLLASRLDPRTYNNIVSRFLTTLSDEDPLRSLYQHLFGKLPAAARTCKDWVAHLATMVANPSSFAESDKSNIMTLGDTLSADGQTTAAHLCYLLAGCSIGRLTDPAAKVILLGHDHRNVKNGKLFPLECFHMTEIFEYAIRLKQQDHMIPSLQMYKYLYCEKLVEAGLYSQALHYLETLAMLMIRSPNMFNNNLIKRVMELSDHLAPYDTEQNYHVAGAADEGGPEWKEMLGKLIHARENDVPFADERESDALGASQAASFFEGYEHQPSMPLTTSSQPPADAHTFETRDDNSVRQRDDVLSTKSGSTTSFQPQACWPHTYQSQDSMTAPLSENNEQYTPQQSYTEGYQPGREQNNFEQQQHQQPNQEGSFEFYQPPQQDSGGYGQPTFQPDQMSVPYQPPAYDPGEMRGQMTWGTQPREEPPVKEPEPKKEKDKTPTKNQAPKQAAQAGWFSGISGLIKKVIPGGPNEMKLPDDSKKPIYYDEKLKRWVNTEEDEEEKAPPPPPPTDFQLGSPGGGPPRPTAALSTTSQQTPGPLIASPHMGPRHAGPAPMMTPQSNMSPGIGRSPLDDLKSETPSGPPSKFSRKAHSGGRLGARAKYVDVFKSNTSSAPIAPPSLFQVLPDAAPTGFFVPPAPDPSTVEGERKIANPSSRPSSRAEDEVQQKHSRSSSQSSISLTSAEVESFMSPNHQEPQQQTPMFFDPSQMTNYAAPAAARKVRRY